MMFLIIFDVLQIIGLTLTAYIGYKAFKEYYRQNSPEVYITIYSDKNFKEFLNTRQPGGDLYAERLQKIEEEIHNLSNIIQGKMVIKSSKVDILEKTGIKL